VDQSDVEHSFSRPKVMADLLWVNWNPGLVLRVLY